MIYKGRLRDRRSIVSAKGAVRHGEKVSMKECIGLFLNSNGGIFSSVRRQLQAPREPRKISRNFLGHFQFRVLKRKPRASSALFGLASVAPFCQPHIRTHFKASGWMDKNKKEDTVNLLLWGLLRLAHQPSTAACRLMHLLYSIVTISSTIYQPTFEY